MIVLIESDYKIPGIIFVLANGEGKINVHKDVYYFEPVKELSVSKMPYLIRHIHDKRQNSVSVLVIKLIDEIDLIHKNFCFKPILLCTKNTKYKEFDLGERKAEIRMLGNVQNCINELLTRLENIKVVINDFLNQTANKNNLCFILFEKIHAYDKYAQENDIFANTIYHFQWKNKETKLSLKSTLFNIITESLKVE